MISPTAIMTYSGVAFDLAAPRPQDVNLDDLAFSLGGLPRFNAHARGRVSVAQHSVLVAAAIWRATEDRIAAAHGLLHDAHEAYTGDITAPLKRVIRALAPGLLELVEVRAQASVLAWAGLIDSDHDALVKAFDLRSLYFEQDTFHRGGGGPRELAPLGSDDVLGADVAWPVFARPWTSEHAERAFRYALSVLLPDVPRGPSSDRWPTPWMAAGLRAALPPSIAEVARG